MRSLVLATAALLLLAGETALGQAAYPARPVRIIVPFGPGGSGDITARTFGHYLETQARQAVVIENRPGGNGVLGTEAAKLAAPDGYTLLLTTNTTHAANVSLSSHIEGGKLVALGVTGEKRRAVWPNVPALGELYPGYELFGFLGLAAPIGTPPEVLDALNVWVNKAIDSPAVRQTLEKHGMDVKPQSRAEHQAFIAREIERWRAHVKTAGIEPQ